MRFWSDKPDGWRGDNLNVTILHASAGIAQQILVQSPQARLLVDAGDGSLRDLLGQDADPSSIDMVLITHGHYDHMGGLHSLLGFMRMRGRTSPLIIAAPEGCVEVGSAVRSFLEHYKDTTPFRIELRELKEWESIVVGDVTVVGYPMVHCGSTAAGGILAPIPAMGYELTCNRERVAISGDTGDCPALWGLVEDVNLAIIEATFPPGTPVTDEMLHNVHLTEELANKIGRTARDHMLVHKTPGQ